MDDYRRALAVTLSAALAYRKMTQRELGERVGVAENTVWKWCTNRAEMRANYIAGVADALDIPDEVFTRPGQDRDEAMRSIVTALARRRAAERAQRQP